jgi:hypothetical protein
VSGMLRRGFEGLVGVGVWKPLVRSDWQELPYT